MDTDAYQKKLDEGLPEELGSKYQKIEQTIQQALCLHNCGDISCNSYGVAGRRVFVNKKTGTRFVEFMVADYNRALVFGEDFVDALQGVIELNPTDKNVSFVYTWIKYVWGDGHIAEEKKGFVPVTLPRKGSLFSRISYFFKS